MEKVITDPAVVVDNVKKTYVVTEGGSRDAKSFFAKMSKKTKEVKSLKGVSLIVRAGESVGLIGRNGSGKSTLLKLIAGAEPPTEGKVLVSSRPTLLGVAPALQPYLSGRQNIILGCLALGMAKDEALQLEPSISQWADIGDAIERPMNTYSAGQMARLSFAISTAVHPEILLIDEALSTGDGAFVEKAKARMAGLLSEAGTLFLVSHATAQIVENCARSIWIHNGQIIADGPTETVVPRYTEWISLLGKKPNQAAALVKIVQKELEPISISSLE
ncbi:MULTISPECIES: ABC transporter ATP-binding protein [Corynebacterium]|uniref:ABC transporter ATP-binding protein n=2 Tax=Corynebacterium glucuronolyticum TaxID=39791 RepID=A0A7T4EHD0_9CORY|nr:MULTISPECIES: ATP-binding cassette domain-containing protein [Corynebacterium]EEI62300.1 ABC transporter, ATP-binding protein [Corynebacterium glucuronolyticum ATCC 51866]MDH4659377.1 ABC transporter ATP-binding protein [Corynebacterium pyruviciproducens]QQB47423.1 ABC transporter ATP-binding protein [Corynebacterium glucuronolyticum]QRP70031.1 ABC transporter ATP-binding protein [Corynebacterium glucuronolyticum]WKD64240.1 Teichoic acids export ATP-binding protein TagH [Corynebacterium glu